MGQPAIASYPPFPHRGRIRQRTTTHMSLIARDFADDNSSGGRGGGLKKVTATARPPDHSPLTQGDTPAFPTAHSSQIVVPHDGILGVVQPQVPDDHLHLQRKQQLHE